MSAHVLLNLLNELGKRDKMRGLPSILSLFRAGTSYSLSRILSQAHAYAIYYDTKYLSIIFTIFIY